MHFSILLNCFLYQQLLIIHLYHWLNLVSLFTLDRFWFLHTPSINIFWHNSDGVEPPNHRHGEVHCPSSYEMVVILQLSSDGHLHNDGIILKTNEILFWTFKRNKNYFVKISIILKILQFKKCLKCLKCWHFLILTYR